MEEVGFMTFTAAGHQEAINMLWLHFWGATHGVHLYLQTMEPTNTDIPFTRKQNREKKQVLNLKNDYNN